MLVSRKCATSGTRCHDTEILRESLVWIADHCRKVSKEHLALAETAEGLMELFLDNRKFHGNLRTFARHHRKAARQHLEMAERADAARRRDQDDFDLTDVVAD